MVIIFCRYRGGSPAFPPKVWNANPVASGSLGRAPGTWGRHALTFETTTKDRAVPDGEKVSQKSTNIQRAQEVGGGRPPEVGGGETGRTEFNGGVRINRAVPGREI